MNVFNYPAFIRHFEQLCLYTCCFLCVGSISHTPLLSRLLLIHQDLRSCIRMPISDLCMSIFASEILPICKSSHYQKKILNNDMPSPNSSPLFLSSLTQTIPLIWIDLRDVFFLMPISLFPWYFLSKYFPWVSPCFHLS